VEVVQFPSDSWTRPTLPQATVSTGPASRFDLIESAARREPRPPEWEISRLGLAVFDSKFPILISDRAKSPLNSIGVSLIMANTLELCFVLIAKIFSDTNLV
jgi:hypothetical protein